MENTYIHKNLKHNLEIKKQKTYGKSCKSPMTTWKVPHMLAHLLNGGLVKGSLYSLVIRLRSYYKRSSYHYRYATGFKSWHLRMFSKV